MTEPSWRPPSLLVLKVPDVLTILKNPVQKLKSQTSISTFQTLPFSENINRDLMYVSKNAK